MRVCLVYDCLYPWTVGGAERWYRGLADELVRAGHEVTYLTRRQWEPGDEPRIDGVRVVAVAPGGPLYTDDGRRRIGAPLRFGIGVLGHLLRHRRSYDVVHTCAFPYFSLLAARAALVGRPTMIGVDWFEVWSLRYWQDYLGRVGGRIGWAVQRLCVWLTQRAFVFSDLHARRLREEGLRGEPLRLAGLYAGAPRDDAGPAGAAGPAVDAAPAAAAAPATNATSVTPEPSTPESAVPEPSAPVVRAPVVLFAGRHIAEKRAELVPAAVMAARERIPELRGLILGDGPERPRVLAAIRAAGAEGVVEAPGFVSADAVAEAMRAATCLLLPSAREGYGLVVIEAAAAGTPTVVTAGVDNAAAELIDDAVNGYVARDDAAIAAAIVACHAGGEALRATTRAWFAEHVERLSAATSARAIAGVYAADGTSRDAEATHGSAGHDAAPPTGHDAPPAAGGKRR